MIYAVVDYRISNSILKNLSNFAERILPLPPHPSLPAPVASHPDMLLWQFGKQIVTYADYLSVAKNIFRELEALGYSIVTTDKSPSDKYPDDVGLKCAVVEKTVFCNKKHVSKKVRDISDKDGMTVLHVNQGYAKCSTVCVSPDAIITADPSIYSAATAAGIDALKIAEGHVRLDGYDTGFIGGATGVTDTEVLFCGNLSFHPDAERISGFCATHGKRAVSLSKEPLYDYGTVMFFAE